MADKTDGGDQSGRAGDAGGPKKPFATIDLKATEVKAAAGKSAGYTGTMGPGAGAKTTAGASAAAAGAPAPGTEPTSATSAGNAESKTSGAKTKATEAKATEAKATEAKANEVKGTGKAGGSNPSAPATAGGVRRASSGAGGFFTHLAAGVVGGFLALLGADTVGPQIAPQLGWPHGLASLSESQAQVQARLGALEQATKSAKETAETRLAQAEAKLAKFDELAKSNAALAETQTRLAGETRQLRDTVSKPAEPAPRIVQLEERLNALVRAAESDPQAGRLPQLAQLTGKVADLETALASQGDTLKGTLSAQVSERMAAVEGAAGAAKAGTERLDHDMASLRGDAAKLAGTVDGLKAGADKLGAGLKVLQDDQGATKAAVESLKSDVDRKFGTLAPVVAKVAGLETNVATIVSGEDNRKASAEKIVLSLELANLKRAVDRGQPFAPEFASVVRSSGGKLDLKAIEPFKDKGVATLGDLTRDFRQVANAALDAVTVPAGAGVVDRLIASAKSVVRVRNINASPDDMTPEAVIGRMDQALKGESLSGAIEEAKHLPPAAQDAMRDWLNKASARATVDKAILAVEAALKASLAQVGGDTH